jgi:hypothetical protein
MCNADAEVAGTPLEGLLQSIQGFVVGSTFELTPAELGDHLIRLRHGIDLLELGFAAEAAVFAATDEYDAQGSVSPIDWIRHHCHMTGHAAARAVAAGEQVHRLPASVAALEAGEIGFAHFSLLAGTARALSVQAAVADVDALDPASEDGASDVASDPADLASPADPAVPAAPLPFDERTLLELAREHSVGRFGTDCTQARHAHDAAAVLAEAVSAAERNRCEFLPCEGGFLALRGYFDPIAAATLQTAVFPLAKPTGAGDHRPRARRLADALVEIASHALDLGAVPSTGGASTHLQLTASVETVMGLEGAPGGELEFAGAVPADTVQRLACDARVRRILLGPNSAVIDVGRSLRVPGPAARAALRVRAGGCEWPGCDRPVAFTTAHHFVHWGHGGETEIANLVLLCYRHHWMVHEGGWQLARVEQGRLLAIPPARGHRSWIRPPGNAAAG